MKRIVLMFLFVLALAAGVHAQSPPPLKITETDGVPSKTNVKELVFPAGTLTIDGSKVTFSVGSLGGGTVNNSATLTAGQLVVGDGTTNLTVGNLSGDISTSGSAVTAIGAGKVTNAMLAGSITSAKLASVSGNGTKLVTTTGTLTSGDCVKIDASGNFIANGSACGSGGGGTPGGSNAQFQYNNSSAFGGVANFTYDGTTIKFASSGTVGAFDITGGSAPGDPATGDVRFWVASSNNTVHFATSTGTNALTLDVPDASASATKIGSGTAGRVLYEQSNNRLGEITGATSDGTTMTMASPVATTALVTTSSTFALVNTTATTVNAFGATTALNLGASATMILNFGGSTTASEFRFLEPSGSGTNYSAFKAVAQGANITYSLPATVGAAGTFLRDAAGNGVLDWASASGSGTVTSIATTSPITGGTITTTGTIACATCVTSAAALTSTALVTGAGSQGSQTPSATATLDSSGNISTPGSASFGVGGSAAGTVTLTEGTAPSLTANAFSVYAPADVAAGGLAYITPAAASSGVLQSTNSSGVMTISHSALTSGRVTFATTNGLLSDDADLTFATDTLTATKIIGSTSITNSALTSGRVVFSGASGIQSDDADLTFATDTLTFTKGAATTSLTVAGAFVTNNIVQNSQSTAYTVVLGDAGKHIYHPSADTTARTFTIDSNANVAYPIGTSLTFVNDCSAGTLTIAITSDTLVLAGAGTTGSRTITACGMATAIKVTSTRWIINGTNLN